MADLRKIRMRALVSETDIGQIRAGQDAGVTVDAYPNRQFHGLVEKIEPQAVVQQSVTMFPVLVTLSNEQGLLLPGMNGEITVLVEQRSNVLAAPVDALRGVRDVGTIAEALGLDPDSVRAQVRAQMESRRAAPAAAGEGARGAPGRGADSTRRAARWGTGAGRGGSTGAGDSGAGRRGWGGRASGWSRGSGTGGSSPVAGRGAGGSSGASGTGAAGGSSGGSGSGTGSQQAQVAFVQTPRGFEPRLVRVGVSNYDYTEVLAGLKEGDKVALLSVGQLQEQRREMMDRIRQRVGGTVPGVSGGTGGGAAGGARGGGGGR
jgi:HlyD family secretion protein